MMASRKPKPERHDFAEFTDTELRVLRDALAGQVADEQHRRKGVA
jgi:hypothetical protein